MVSKQKSRLAVVFAALIALPLLSACGEEQGPAEQLGESIDETVEEAGDKLEAAADELEQKTD
mgnify:CR=1 FL=1